MQHELESGFIGIRDLANRLAISARSVWRIIERGELSVTRIGRRTLVGKAEVAHWLAGQQHAKQASDVNTNASRQFAVR